MIINKFILLMPRLVGGELHFYSIKKTEVPPELVFNAFLDAINKGVPEPYFAWIHLYPPHDPYLPPLPYVGMFEPSNKLRTFREQRFWFAVPYVNTEDTESVNILRARYDEFIRYCDNQFEEFIQQLMAINELENTVVMLSSDHGESFEHDYIGHKKNHLYEPVTHIPLIIKVPGQTEGRVIEDLIEQIDIPPTILELSNIPIPSWVEGRSLVKLMRGGQLPLRPAFSMNLEKSRSPGQPIDKGTIAVWEGEYKLIEYLETGRLMLFNIKKDPEELNNIFDTYPETGRRLSTIIKENLHQANGRIRKKRGKMKAR